VLDSNPMFLGIGPARGDLIGQCCWYIASDNLDHYRVDVAVGWGDCPSGCINEHRWAYRVDHDRTITLLDEFGDSPVEAPPQTGSGPGTVTIQAVAGPVCPIEPFPPDPACNPRPVAGAEVVVYAAGGVEAARGLTNDEGLLVVALEAGGYWVEGLDVEGLMGAPEAVAFSVGAGGRMAAQLTYDTGIR
jgi:hypothetical protein